MPHFAQDSGNSKGQFCTPAEVSRIIASVIGISPDADSKLAEYWQVMPGLRDSLFENSGRKGCWQLRLDLTEVKPAILDHEEYVSFKTDVTGIYKHWLADNRPG